MNELRPGDGDEGGLGAERDLSDRRTILAGTAQNVAGLGIAATATFVAQILIGNVQGRAAFGVITVATQAAFVLSFLTRAGMDMAVLRAVAMAVGRGERDGLRTAVSRAATIAGGLSLVVAVALAAFEGAVRRAAGLEGPAADGVIAAAAAGLPFLALTNVWLGATRGLKIMRYTLYVFWAGQPLVWILAMLAGWAVGKGAWVTVAAYSASWAIAAALAWTAWRRESVSWPRSPAPRAATGGMLRFAGPRAPAALLAQLLFWADLFVVTRFVSEASVGVYSAALRAGQIVVLFLTSVNLMFSPYVADLHARGETARLDGLFKTLTRWTVAATLPLFLIVAAAPGSLLGLFGEGFAGGETALLILLAGQFVNVLTGSVGFVLIMAGRTGWDLAIYAGSIALDLVVAFGLAPTLGIRGAAVANAVTFAVSNLVRLALVRRFVGIQPYDRRYLRLAGPALVGAAGAWGGAAVAPGEGILDLAAAGAACLICYLAALVTVGSGPAERAELRGLAAGARRR